MRLSISEIASILNLGAPESGDTILTAVCTDSRDCKPGCLFACIKGDKVDGHDYALSAVANGAGAILAERDLPACGAEVLRVDNTIAALCLLAAHWREVAKSKVICLTGTAGKTTLKDLLADILSFAGATARSEKNHNNQLGMALSILAASGQERFWVLEAGISHAGDMDELGQMAKPDLALILNIGQGHTEGLGGKGVAWHKASLLRHIAKNGVALVSADYPELVREALATGARTFFFSTQNNAEATYKLVCREQELCQLNLAGKPCSVETDNIGLPDETIVAAASAAEIAGADCADIGKGFHALKMPEHRFNIVKIGQWQVIDATYNANPLSMRHALETAARLAQHNGAPLLAVLGEMGELGALAPAAHRELGKLLGKLGASQVYWHGDYLEELAAGIGWPAVQIRILDAPEAFAAEAAKLDTACVAVFKGSRSNKMERYLDAFLKTRAAGEGKDVL